MWKGVTNKIQKYNKKNWRLLKNYASLQAKGFKT